MDLLGLAREYLESYFSEEDNGDFEVSDELKEKFKKKEGVFVTLTKKGELRGCIGFVKSKEPLWKTILEAAKGAAFHDPRFRPLSEEELGEVKIHISILSEHELIKVDEAEDCVDKVKLGKDGLIMTFKGRSGLLLPEVPIEQGWDVEEFLDHLCLKAGLGEGCWKEPECKIFKFTTKKISE